MPPDTQPTGDAPSVDVNRVAVRDLPVRRPSSTIAG
jgi:hypothetical protein